MPHLPQELVDMIVVLLAEPIELDIRPYKNPIAQYATINRAWAVAVERYTFRSIHLQPSDCNIKKVEPNPFLGPIQVKPADSGMTVARLAQALQREGGYRRYYMKFLAFKLDYENHPINHLVHDSSPAQSRATTDAVFSRDIADLWAILAHWPRPSKLRLELSLDGPKSYNHGMIKTTDFLNYVGGPLPLLSNVKSLMLGTNACIQPQSVTQLLTSLPALEEVFLDFDELCNSYWYTEEYSVISIDTDTALLGCIAQIPYSCESVDLYVGYAPYNQLGPNDAFLCAGMAPLSLRLIRLNLTGSAASVTLLDIMAALPWPRLKYLDANYTVTGDDCEPNFRFVNDLQVAAGRAARATPSLVAMNISYTEFGDPLFKSADWIDVGLDIRFSCKKDERLVEWDCGELGGKYPLLEYAVLKAWGVDKHPEDIEWYGSYGRWTAQEVVDWKVPSKQLR